jgi:hypothetical protein
MDKTIVILLIIAASAFISYFVRQVALNRITRQLYQAAYVEKDAVLFESLIDSLPAQMFISEKSRKIMALNFYIASDNEEKVVRTCRETNMKRLDANEFKTFCGSAIGYLCDRKNPYAETLLNEMKKRYAGSKDISQLMLLYDCELTYDVYIAKNTDRISDIEEILKNDLSDEERAVYEYRLAKLYDYQDNKAKVKQLLKSARSHTANRASQKKIDEILNGNRSLL